jgi:sugar O-acyltransferase (sialic acid O-acetyltransferase NeuD family)
MQRVIIFGIQDFAELAWFYLTSDSPYQVVGFTVNRAYVPEGGYFKNLPVVAFEEIEAFFPPGEFMMFAPMSPKGMNKVRQQVYLEIKQKGYECISYISSKATIFNNVVGENCFILEDNTIQPFTTIGNNVVLWSGNHIGHHGRIKDHVSFTSHVVMSGHCIIENNSFFGVNATLRDGITIGEGTLVAMSASVTKSTEAWGVYIGNPAKLLEKKKSTDLL